MVATYAPTRTAAADPMPERPPLVRLNDWYEVYTTPDAEATRLEAARCMSCGAPFCQPSGGYKAGCPIENRIPEFNELVQLGQWREAYERLTRTNPFPEFTSRACPAPCQDACIHGLNGRPVAIKSIERAIIDRAFDEGWVRPQPPASRSGRSAAVIGSGPAGLAAAEALNRAGHYVSVFERSDRIGGLLMYGVPNMKLDKRLLDRRVQLLAASGIRFITHADVGGRVPFNDIRGHYDAVLLACGAQRPRELAIPGNDLRGIHPAMAYLTAATRALKSAENLPAELNAYGKDVVVIGGGDTGTDCIATAMRQGCRSVLNITRREREPVDRYAARPWPQTPGTYKLDYAHKEGLAHFGRDPREYAVQPIAFTGDEAGAVAGIKIRRLRDRAETVHETLPSQLILLAIGFTSTDADLPIPRPTSGHTEDGNIFTAGDLRIGPSLIVHAIADGRAAARAIDAKLQSQRSCC